MKIKKFVALGLTALAITGLLTGCSSELKDAQKNINSVGLNALNGSKIVNVMTDDEFSDYVFSGADFVLDGGNYILDVSGFSTTANNKKAYTNMEYVVESSEFDGVDAKNSAEVINAIAKVIAEYEMTSFDYAPMKSLDKFNNSMNKTFESPVNGYKLATGLTYAVDDITFNEKDGYVSFSTRQNTDYSKTTTEMVYMFIGTDTNGNAKWGFRPQVKTYHEKFNQEHVIYIKASEEEIALMKEDNSLIFDKFVELVNEGQKTDYTVRSVNIQTDKAFDDNSGFSLSD